MSSVFSTYTVFPGCVIHNPAIHDVCNFRYIHAKKSIHTVRLHLDRMHAIDDSPIKICVVTTDEEMRIARETDNLVSQLG